MANKIVLISEDTNFFEFIITKLELRKTDELFSFTFDNILENIHHITTSLVIINSEGAHDKTLELLKLLKGTPTIICAYNNDNDSFRKLCYRAGAFDFLTLLTPDSEFRARLIPALTISDLLKKNRTYREILVQKNIITTSNEVYIEYNEILETQLEKIKNNAIKAVFAAISPNEKNKFLLQANQIETIILNNIRLNDILMNYAPNKYFLIMFDTDIKSAEKLWQKISAKIPERVYAGFANITNQNKQQIINEALNKLHLAINNDKNIEDWQSSAIKAFGTKDNIDTYTNFKAFKQDFEKKLENVITPVFYHVQQKYTDKFMGISIQHSINNGLGNFIIKNGTVTCSFRITCPGFSKINIDVTFQKNSDDIDAKRITLDPEELEAGLLEDLLEQFITEYKKEFNN